ncbi:hypothetical protein BT69DRAFT_1319643 [Atractiella rhizophila]|nr:hypothetical protein BT69DRAFT_1319643 [Atractiella rhizophila]
MPGFGRARSGSQGSSGRGGSPHPLPLPHIQPPHHAFQSHPPQPLSPPTVNPAHLPPVFPPYATREPLPLPPPTHPHPPYFPPHPQSHPHSHPHIPYPLQHRPPVPSLSGLSSGSSPSRSPPPPPTMSLHTPSNPRPGMLPSISSVSPTFTAKSLAKEKEKEKRRERRREERRRERKSDPPFPLSPPPPPAAIATATTMETAHVGPNPDQVGPVSPPHAGGARRGSLDHLLHAHEQPVHPLPIVPMGVPVNVPRMSMSHEDDGATHVSPIMGGGSRYELPKVSSDGPGGVELFREGEVERNRMVEYEGLGREEIGVKVEEEEERMEAHGHGYGLSSGMLDYGSPPPQVKPAPPERALDQGSRCQEQPESSVPEGMLDYGSPPPSSKPLHPPAIAAPPPLASPASTRTPTTAPAPAPSPSPASGKSSAPPAPHPLSTIRPYAPHRLTAPKHMTRPLSLAEAQRHFSESRNPLRVHKDRDWSRFLPSGAGGPSGMAGAWAVGGTKRGIAEVEGTERERERERERGERAEKRVRREEGVVSEVMKHYDSRPELGRGARNFSPIIGLKNYNNWVKSVLINKFCTGVGKPRKGVRVLEMGCGKGGDLLKWQKTGSEKMVGADLASVSVEQARNRWLKMNPPKFHADFFALDCFSEPIAPLLKEGNASFDTVSMQFCMHYAFESEAKVRMMLTNVTSNLESGGVFLGTVPDDRKILAHIRDENGRERRGPVRYGNDVYTISFEEAEAPRETYPYGHKYYFFLQDAVEEVPEFVVYWEQFEQLAASFGLKLLYRVNFSEVWKAEKGVPEFRRLAINMKVLMRDALNLSPSEQEASGTQTAKLNQETGGP